MHLSRPTRRRLPLVLAAAATVGALVLAGTACAAPDAGAAPRDPDPTAGTASPSAADVEATRAALDARADRAPDSVVSWGVDPAVGLVVVEVSGQRDAEVDRFLAGLDPRTLRVATETAAPRPLPGQP